MSQSTREEVVRANCSHNWNWDGIEFNAIYRFVCSICGSRGWSLKEEGPVTPGEPPKEVYDSI